MSPDLRFAFLADRTRHRITIEREFAARQSMVWDCYTKRDLLDRWFAPKPLTTRTKFMDFRAGGCWHYAMIMPDGTEFWSRLDYETIAPISGFTALEGFSDCDGNLNPDMPRAHWKVDFSERNGRAVVRTVVAYRSAEDLQKVIDMGMEAGMTSTLERLDELLIELTR